MQTPTRPVAAAYPSAAWPAPCSWRTRMCRTVVESMSGSYAGRIAPPGMPKTVSTPSCSSERTRAWAPVICAGAASGGWVTGATEAGRRGREAGGVGRRHDADHRCRGRDGGAGGGAVSRRGRTGPPGRGRGWARSAGVGRTGVAPLLTGPPLLVRFGLWRSVGLVRVSGCHVSGVGSSRQRVVSHKKTLRSREDRRGSASSGQAGSPAQTRW